MSRQEKRRKFNEAVVNMLYPPPLPSQPQDGDESLNNLREGFDTEPFSDELGLGQIGSSTTSEDDDDDGNDCGSQKLTRAQRKRLRRKKLKEDASCRRKIIGPLLPPQNNGKESKDTPKARGDELENKPPTVRCYAAEEEAHDKPGEQSTSGKQSKIKQRRMAKKLAKKSQKMSSDEECFRDQNLSSTYEHQAYK